MPPAADALLVLVLLLVGPVPPLGAAHANPLLPRFGLVIQVPRNFIREVPLGARGEPLLGAGGGQRARRGEAADARSGLFDLGFSFPYFSQSVSKRVRAKTSYQASGMAYPRITGCEAVCALRNSGGGA